MKFQVFVNVCLCALSSVAVPTVERVSLSVDETDAKRAKVSYELTGEAVVTAEICAKGVTCPGAFEGAVNARLVAGEHTFFWRPDEGGAGSYSPGELKVKLSVWDPDDPPPYMAVDLYRPQSAARYYASASDVPGSPTSGLYKTEWMLFRRIPASETEKFQMKGGGTHWVRLTKDYYLGVFEVTVSQYRCLMGNLSDALQYSTTIAGWDLAWNDEACPVQIPYDRLRKATWPSDARGTSAMDAECHLRKFRERYGIDFDLPTEAEWEFAAQGGGTESETAVGDFAWYAENSAVPHKKDGTDYGCFPHPVGLKRPNAFGLYDMMGNMAEWVLDFKKGTLPTETPYAEDPVGPSESEAEDAQRIVRGGSYASEAGGLGVDGRLWAGPGNWTLQVGVRERIAPPTTHSYSIGFRFWAPAKAVK